MLFIVDYIYKDGAVISLELPVMLHLPCVPEYNGDYNNTECFWRTLENTGRSELHIQQ